MGIVRVTAPTTEPVTLAEVKKQVIADDFTDDDVLLQAMLDAAIDHMDGWAGILGRALMTQEWAVQTCEWQTCFTMPMKPVKGVVLKYWDEDGVEQTVSNTSYRVSAQSVFLNGDFNCPPLFSRGDAVSAVFTLGEDDAADVPAGIKQAILLMVGGMYANREQYGAQVYENPTFDLLVAPYRRMHP